MWRTILGGKIWRGELINRSNNGSVYNEEMTITPIQNGPEKITHFIAIKQDITERKRVEEHTRMLSNAVENSPDLVGMTGPEGGIVYVNRALREALQFSEEELLGKHFQNILSMNNSPKLLQEIQNKARNRADGEVSVLCPGRREPISRCCSVPALSREVMAEYLESLELRRISRSVSALSRNSSSRTLSLRRRLRPRLMPSWPWMRPIEVILSNRQFAAMWSVPPGMILAGDDAKLLQYVTDQIEDPHRFLEKVAHLYTHREEKSLDEVRLKDGRVLDRYSSPLIDSAAMYHGRIWYFRDITERVKSEERLQLWSRVLDQSGEGIFVCDKDERILMVNRAFERLTGFSADDAVGKTPRILQSGLQNRAFYADMWKSVLETGMWRGEMWNRRKTGEVYVEWLSISAVRDREGSVAHFIGIFSDITVRKQAEERIVHLAHYDALTDLPNRVLLMDRLSQLTKAAIEAGPRSRLCSSILIASRR